MVKWLARRSPHHDESILPFFLFPTNRQIDTTFFCCHNTKSNLVTKLFTSTTLYHERTYQICSHPRSKVRTIAIPHIWLEAIERILVVPRFQHFLQERRNTLFFRVTHSLNSHATHNTTASMSLDFTVATMQRILFFGNWKEKRIHWPKLERRNRHCIFMNVC